MGQSACSKAARRHRAVVLARECLDVSEAIQNLSEKQELMAALMESKKRLQKDASERFQEQIFQEMMMELEEQKSKDAWSFCDANTIWELCTRKGIEPGFYSHGSRQGLAVLLWQQTVLPSVLARPLWRVTWMKQCPRLPGNLPLWRRKEIGGALDLDGEMEKLEVEGSFLWQKAAGQLGRCIQKKRVKK